MTQKQNKKKMGESVTTKPDSSLALQIDKLSKRYSGNKEYSILNLDFNVKRGQFHGFIGANGAGKTTTIKSIVGAYANFEGAVHIFGKKHSSIEAKKMLGYIPENTRFPKGLTTFQFIYYLSRMSGVSKEKAKKHTIQVLEDVNMTKLAKKNPNSFSSGQKKKVLLAQALVHDPEVIIMDEPAANLDPQARAEFFQTLKNLTKKGKTIFISSHILAEIEHYIDSLTILDGGKVVFTGLLEEISHQGDFKYEVALTETKELNNFLKENNLKANKNIVDFIEEKNIHKFLAFVAKNKLHLTKFVIFKKNLQDIYNDNVKLGSMQTKKEGK